MWKFALKFGLIIMWNLFAFLIVWTILDALFETGRLFLVIGLVLSVLSLMVIWSIYVRKAVKECASILSKEDGEKLKELKKEKTEEKEEEINDIEKIDNGEIEKEKINNK